MAIVIVAVDNNWGIGRNGDLLIDIPEDKQFFKNTTNNSIVIMGRKTWNSLPKKPLPNRKNYVITRTPDNNSENNVKFITLIEAIEIINNPELDLKVCVIGGGQIYKELLPYCNMVLITRVYREFDSDTYFPDIDNDPDWEIIGESQMKYYGEIPYQFFVYTKKESLSKK